MATNKQTKNETSGQQKEKPIIAEGHIKDAPASRVAIRETDGRNQSSNPEILRDRLNALEASIARIEGAHTGLVEALARVAADVKTAQKLTEAHLRKAQDVERRLDDKLRELGAAAVDFNPLPDLVDAIQRVRQESGYVADQKLQELVGSVGSNQ